VFYSVSFVILELLKVALDVCLVTKLLVCDTIMFIILYKWLLVGFTLQEATFDGEKPESRI
jgi:hypothetical protein